VGWTPAFQFLAVAGIFLFASMSRPSLGTTQLHIPPRFISSEVKRLGREADHSLPSSDGVKNAWNYTSSTPVRLHGVVLG